VEFVIEVLPEKNRLSVQGQVHAGA
jgi:hypothetical protein